MVELKREKGISKRRGTNNENGEIAVKEWQRITSKTGKKIQKFADVDNTPQRDDDVKKTSSSFSLGTNFGEGVTSDTLDDVTRPFLVLEAERQAMMMHHKRTMTT